jgi:CheY-like chemotaxis protein
MADTEEGQHVLVASGDRRLCATLRTLLEDAGYVVLQEGSGVDVINRLARSDGPLVVLLDARLHGELGAPELLEMLEAGFLPRRHAMLLVADRPPAQLPSPVQFLVARLGLPVVRTPVLIDVLLDTVADAAGRLVPLPVEGAPDAPSPR